MSAWPNLVASAASVAPLASAAPNAPISRVAASGAVARSARLKRFEREQVVVEYLNRGVSVVEIAARIGVGEKRAGALIRDPRRSGGSPGACPIRPPSSSRSR